MCPDGFLPLAHHSRVVVYALGRFEVLINGAPLRFKGRAPLRALELLTALVAVGDGGANAGRLADQLWPDADGFDAYRAFTTTLHRLRRLLGSIEAVTLSAGRLSLNARVCTVDAWEFERALRGAADADAVAAVLDSCGGPLLADDPSPWAIAARARLEHLIARKNGRLATAPRRSIFGNGFEPALVT